MDRAAAALRSAETAALVWLQRRTERPSVVAAAAALGRVGDHAACWVLLGAAGWLLDGSRRGEWARALAAVLGAHAATVVLKRVLRRRRPHGAGVLVRAPSPTGLSFPSSHAASTTAAALGYGRLLGVPAAPVLVPAMGASRVALGLHFPTDVLAGAATGLLADRLLAPGLERTRAGQPGPAR